MTCYTLISGHPASDYQAAIFDFVRDPQGGSAVVIAVAGSGKCLGFDTPVMLSDGVIKSAQDIKLGDCLMGPDSAPRQVLSTTIGNGPLFKIIPNKGMPWVCNDAHILTLINSVSDEVFDINLLDYIRDKGTRKLANAKLLRCSIDFNKQHTLIPPYLVGLWIGDGSTKDPIMWNPDKEIIDYCTEIGPLYGCDVIKLEVPGCIKIRFRVGTRKQKAKSANYIWRGFKQCVLDNEKRIHPTYLFNDRQSRLELLAGILDSDGHIGSHVGGAELVTKVKKLSEDYLFLCRSLGFAAYVAVRTINGKPYYRLSISGDLAQIPNKVERKKSPPRLINKSVLRTGFKIEPIGNGNFYGFTINGDGRFLLGDFTIAHNTTTAINCLAHIPVRDSVQMFAFNVSVAKKLKADVAELARDVSRVRTGTFHSVGVGAVAKFLNKRIDDLTIDSGKCRKILKAHVGEDEMATYGSFACRLVGYAKGEGVGVLVPDTEDTWYGIIDHHGMYLDSEDGTIERAIDIARSLLRRSSVEAKSGSIDYDDMLYLPLLWKLRLWQNDWVFVDELQDTNPVRRAFAKLALRPRGRLVGLGDPRQSIYGFTGASIDAIELVKREFNARELPLTVSYRCARSVVAHAKQWVEYIEPFEGAVEGVVEEGVSFDEAVASLTDNDAILCRQRAPLVTAAYAIIKNGRGCRILGRDIGEGLVDLIKACRARGIDSLLTKLDQFRDREMARLIAKGDEPGAEAVDDRVSCVEVIIGHLPETERTIPALIRRIGDLFKDDGSAMLTLCTIHKAKGLEWPQVAILEPQLMPSRAARTEWQICQEENIQYVAATRAQQRLIYMEAIS